MPMLKKSFLFISFFFALSIFSFLTSKMGKGMLEKMIRMSKYGFSKKEQQKDNVRTPPIYPPKHSEHVTLCNTKFNSKDTNHQQGSDAKQKVIPTIYFITPTYPRSEQIAELTRLAQTLLHIKNLHWVVAEDSPYCSKMLYSLLEHFGMPYTHLSSPMPNIYKILSMKDRPRGVSSRRAGLQWVLNHHKAVLNQTIHQNDQKSNISSAKHSSVVYFGDDDNT